MEDSYIRTIVRNENLCREYMAKADEAYRLNGNRHSKEECVWLQRAALCRSEMARASTGEERYYQQRRQHELNTRIENIVRILNPEAFEKAAAGKGGSRKGAGASTGAPVSTQPASVDEVSGWFKEAPKHSFADVSGMEELKTRLRGCVADARLAKLKAYLRIKNLRSYFFIGPPGCGKTYVIEAFAHELMDKDYQYLSLAGSDILSKYVGEAEKIVTRLFEEAESHAPCIVFIDEIDGVCKNRSLPNLPEYASSITTAFLTGYNRIHNSDKPIIFIGATNYPDQVDNAMLDRVELVRVPLPDEQARAFSFRQKFEGMLRSEEGLSFTEMAARTERYNYRDIDRLCNKIKDMVIQDVMRACESEDEAIEALSTGRYALRGELFERALGECLPTPKDDILRSLDEWESRFKSGGE